VKWRPLPVVIDKIVSGGKLYVNPMKVKKSASLSHSGITDLSTQLNAVQENFPEVKRVSYWFVMGIILLYIVVIGPIDYLIVQRLFKRPQLTWITFPIWVCLGTVGALLLGQSTNGNRIRMNQIDIVDIDTTTQSLRVQSWYTLYSINNERYEIQATFQPQKLLTSIKTEPSALAHHTKYPLLSWSGIPEDTYTGIYRTGGAEFNYPEYNLTAQGDGIQNLPISVWSTRSLTAIYRARYSTSKQAPSPAPLVESNLSSIGAGALEGEFTHHLAVPLDNWLIAYGSRVYLPRRDRKTGKKASALPGVSISLGSANYQIQYQEIVNLLTRMHSRSFQRDDDLGGEEVLIEQTPYDILGRNVDDIVTMLTFHTAVGGKGYTQLENHSLNTMDLSPLLRIDRAVLFGRVQHPASQLKLNSGNSKTMADNQQATFVRIIIPVTKIKVINKNYLLPVDKLPIDTQPREK